MRPEPLGFLVVGVALAVRHVSPWLHGKVVGVLSERLDSEMTFEAFGVSLLPLPAARGKSPAAFERRKVPPRAAGEPLSHHPAPAAQRAKNEQHDRDNQQQMDEPAHRVGSDDPEQPRDQ